VLLDLEPGMIGAERASPLGELFRPGSLVNQNAGAGKNWAGVRYVYTNAATNYAEPPCSVAAFEVNSEFRAGARPTVRVCVEPELAR
jgi:hypothetical protein